ncbi:MAG: AAA domain-containing protein [Alphaproteobacteria bacterium]|nr:AAA domain-containing protein [Alphaproteobacteria bacterium]
MDALEAASAKLTAARQAVGEAIFGQDEVVAHSLTALLAGGHLLLVGLPGLAKTRLVVTLGKVLGLDNKRLQCTPDLMPSDVIGAEVLEEVDYGRRNFRFIQGPVFTQLLMVDEINRASPRTQSALLQAMQERQVTVAGREHALPAPFHVLATQNPLEQEGVYPLPEAQLDRFLMQIDIGYPDLAAERQILQNTVMDSEPAPKSVMYANDVKEIQQLVRRMPQNDKLPESILSLVRNGRPETSSLEIVRKYVGWGPGPRASQALSLAARARALLEGRLAPSLDDVLALAQPVLRHRMALNFAARADNVRLDDVLNALAQSVAKA